MPEPAAPHAHHEDLLQRLLAECFGGLAGDQLASLRARLQWVELAGGQTLMRQGEPGEAMYVIVSGRLRAYVHDDLGQLQAMREMARGQVAGELALFTGEPRSATVVAIRDSVLVRLDKAGFDALLAAHPAASAALTRQLIQRLLHPASRARPARPVTMAVLPASPGIDLGGFARALAAALSPIGRVQTVDAAAVDAVLAREGLSVAGSGPELDRRVALLLDEAEASTEFLLLVGDDAPTPWTQRCTRHADELLLLADADAEPVLHPVEQAFLTDRTPRAEAAEILVLQHPADRRHPAGTGRWLARRPIAHHAHVRQGHAGDLQRLARLQARTGVGLVFGGGGARGFAHLGVLRALAEQGVVVDSVGGTSIGAVMGALAAADEPLPRVFDVARRAFAANPTGDLNPLPLISLLRGQRLQRVVGAAMRELFGHEAAVEDLWKPFFCIATNFSQAREECIDRGPLRAALLASAAIPGALPPVVRGGDLLCDGGSFNNFPVDVMRAQRGIGTVIGVDLGTSAARRIAFDAMPPWWRLALDRLRPRARRRFRLPSLTSYLMNVTILYSASRREQSRAAADLCFNPPLTGIGMMEWHRFDAVVRQGETHAHAVLAALTPALRQRLTPGARPPAGAVLETAADGAGAPHEPAPVAATAPAPRPGSVPSPAAPASVPTAAAAVAGAAVALPSPPGGAGVGASPAAGARR